MLTFARAIEDLGPVLKAEPKTLYIRRNVLNGDEISEWAKSQGFKTTLTDMHVTMAYSKTKLVWPEPSNDRGIVIGGGDRSLELFGEEGEGATVLQFEAPQLEDRWQELKDAGAVWKWPEYRPHITISYDGPDDLDAIEPYDGDIVFGPEIFEEVKAGWQDTVTEKRKGKAMDFLSVIKGNPHRADLGRYSTARASAIHAHPEGTLVRHKETGRQYGKDELEGGLIEKDGHDDQPRDEHGRFAGGGDGDNKKPDSPHEGKSGSFEHTGSADLAVQGLKPTSRAPGDNMTSAALVAWQHAKNTGETATAQPGGRGWRVVGPKQKLTYGTSHITVSPEGKLHAYSYTLGKSQPSVSDVHATTAIGNGKKRKAKDFRATIGEINGKVVNESGVAKAEGEIHRQSAFRITKIDDEQMAVFGWASVTHINGEVVIDKQGDIIESDELEKAVYDYVRHCREQGDMHERRDVGRLIESTVYTAEKAEKCGITAFDPTTGEQIFGWYVGFKVSAPDVWKRIRSGALPEFSIGGRAIRVPFIEKVMKGEGNPNHDEQGRFASGEGGSGNGERGNQLTSDEHNEFVYAVQSTTDLDGSISDELTDSLNNVSDRASELRDAMSQMNDHNVDDEDGNTQEESADYVRETYNAMKEFSAAADKSLTLATQAASDAKTAMKEFEKYMKEFGIA